MERLQIDVDSRALLAFLWGVGSNLGTSSRIACCRCLLQRLRRSVVRSIHVVKVVNIRIRWKNEMRSIRWLSIGSKC
jgi:hypothetical protein